MFDPVAVDAVEMENPRYADVKALCNRVHAARESLARALRPAAEQLQSGSAWTGPTTARVFTEELSGRSTRLPRLVDHLTDEVEHALATTPRTLFRDIGVPDAF